MTTTMATAMLDAAGEDETWEAEDVDEVFAAMHGRAPDADDGDAGERLSLCYAARAALATVDDEDDEDDEEEDDEACAHAAIPPRVISGYDVCPDCGADVYAGGSEGTEAQSLQRHEGLAALADRRR